MDTRQLAVAAAPGQYDDPSCAHLTRTRDRAAPMCRASVALLVAALAVLAAPVAGLGQSFSVNPLSADLGGPFYGNQVIDFNAAGQVLGISSVVNPDETVYYVWDSDGGMHTIPRSIRDEFGNQAGTRRVFALNDAGQVFGDLPDRVVLDTEICVDGGDCFPQTQSFGVTHGFIMEAGGGLPEPTFNQQYFDRERPYPSEAWENADRLLMTKLELVSAEPVQIDTGVWLHGYERERTTVFSDGSAPAPPFAIGSRSVQTLANDYNGTHVLWAPDAEDRLFWQEVGGATIDVTASLASQIDGFDPDTILAGSSAGLTEDGRVYSRHRRPEDDEYEWFLWSPDGSFEILPGPVRAIKGEWALFDDLLVKDGREVGLLDELSLQDTQWTVTPGESSFLNRHGQILTSATPAGESEQQWVILTPDLGDIFRWVEPDGGLFIEGANWETPEPPGADDTAIFDLPNTYTVALDDEATVGAMEVLAGHVTLELAGRSLHSGELVIGGGDTPTVFTVQGGDEVVASVASASAATSPNAAARLETQQTSSHGGANEMHMPRIIVHPGDEFNLNEPLQAVVSDYVLIDGSGKVTNAAHLQADFLVIGDSEEAEFRVADSGILEANRVVLGDEQDFFGLTGGTGKLVVEDGGTVAFDELLVGDGSEGIIEIRSGGTLSANKIEMADNFMSEGSIHVTGGASFIERSTLETGEWEIGGLGQASVLVSEGGVLTVPENEGVKWTIHADASLAMGTTGISTDSSLINMPSNSALEIQIGSRREAFPFQDTPEMFVSESALATVTAVIVGPLFPESPGQDELHAEGHLVVQGLPVLGDDPGQLWIQQDLKVGRNGVVDVLDGGGIFIGPDDQIQNELLIRETDVSDKIIVLAGGDLTFSGTINVQNEIEARPGSVVFRSGGELNTGDSPGAGTLNADLIMEPGSQWIVEIAGATPGDEHDQLSVTGDAIVDGTVRFEFLDGFAPQEGQQFEFLDIGGLADLSGASIEIQNLAPGFEFDITTGQGGVTMTALSDGHFVPEPGSLALLLLGAAGLCWSHSRGANRPSPQSLTRRPEGR